MCKSANQRGGPYRCSGDARAALDRATLEYTALLDSRVAVQQEQARAQGGLDQTQAMLDEIAADKEINDEEDRKARLDALEPALNKWVARKEAADAEHSRLGEEAGKASQKVQEARKDYEATPQGVAEVQSMIDNQKDPQHRNDLQGQVGLVRRRDAALDRMNAEAAERRRRWDIMAGERVPISRWDDRLNSADTNVYGGLAKQDGLIATSVNHGYVMNGETGREFNDHEVTFYRTGEEGRVEKSMRVSYRSHLGVAEPSQAEVLQHMAAQSVGYETSRTPSPDGTGKHDFRRYCAKQGVSEDDRAAARDDYDEGRRYSGQLRAFLGDEAAGRYMGQAARDSGRFLPMDRVHGRDGKPLFEVVGPGGA